MLFNATYYSITASSAPFNPIRLTHLWNGTCWYEETLGDTGFNLVGIQFFVLQKDVIGYGGRCVTESCVQRVSTTFSRLDPSALEVTMLSTRLPHS